MDEALLREVYAKYLSVHLDWSNADCETPTAIAEELITNLDLVAGALGHPVTWDQLGLERT